MECINARSESDSRKNVVDTGTQNWKTMQLFEYTEDIRTKAIMKAVAKADEMY